MRKPPPIQVFPPPEQRFWAKVDRRGFFDCWPWTGGTVPDGYGSIRVGDRNLNAHRYSWMLHFGPIPDGLLVCHSCDNPPCCNPAHLFLGTEADNLHDAQAKGRWHPPLSISEDEVRRIRERRAAGATYPQMQREFGRSLGTLYRIVERQTRTKAWTA